MSDPSVLLRRIPKVDVLLERILEVDDLRALPRPFLLDSLRQVVDGHRAALATGELGVDADVDALFAGPRLAESVRDAVAGALRRKHTGVINATGILLHTGLGRAPLSDCAIEAIQGAARYAVVEVDPDSGDRDIRENRVAELLVELTGAEAATVVNNNAAACMLTLKALADGKDAIVARGELVEIGGGFRMPDVMAASGCRMIEVGSTNRTYASDYEAVTTAETGVVLKVHTSNYRIVGFTHAPTEEELVEIAHRHGVPFVNDLGAGMIRPVPVSPLEEEPSVRASVTAGADAVLFSGDKLLCGPQAGLIVGSAACVAKVRSHPMYRAVRPGKLDLAALEATLLAWKRDSEGLPGLPLYEMLGRDAARLKAIATRMRDGLADLGNVDVNIVESTGYLGSGSAPARPVTGLSVALAAGGTSAGNLSDELRSGTPRVYARIEDDRVLLDARTVFDEEIDTLIRCVVDAVSRSSK